LDVDQIANGLSAHQRYPALAYLLDELRDDVAVVIAINEAGSDVHNLEASIATDPQESVFRETLAARVQVRGGPRVVFVPAHLIAKTEKADRTAEHKPPRSGVSRRERKALRAVDICLFDLLPERVAGVVRPIVDNQSPEVIDHLDTADG